MKKFLLIFFFISACLVNKVGNDNVPNLKFSDKMTFEDFKSNLKVYSNNSPYPNIDN